MSDTLVAAKQEYTQQLCDLLCPCLYAGFKSVWKTCKTHDNKKKLKSFQEKLMSVPIWNQNVIDNEFNRICKKEETRVLLEKLIEAVFLSNVKVLSTIRIGKAKPINISVPETKKFIHQCYIECARKLWQDPHIIDDRENMLSYSEMKRNEKRLLISIAESIEKTVSRMIPIQSILENYLNDNTMYSDDEVSVESESSDKKSINQEDDTPPLDEDDGVLMEEPDLRISEGKDIQEAVNSEETLVDETLNSIETSPISVKINTPSVNKEDYFFSDSSDEE